MDKQFNVAKNVNTACIDIQLSVVMDDDLINGDRSLCHIHLVHSTDLEDRRIIIDLKRSDVVIKYNDSGMFFALLKIVSHFEFEFDDHRSSGDCGT